MSLGCLSVLKHVPRQYMDKLSLNGTHLPFLIFTSRAAFHRVYIKGHHADKFYIKAIIDYSNCRGHIGQ